VSTVLQELDYGLREREELFMVPSVGIYCLDQLPLCFTSTARCFHLPSLLWQRCYSGVVRTSTQK